MTPWYRWRWHFIAYAPNEKADWRIDQLGKWRPIFWGLWVHVRNK